MLSLKAAIECSCDRPHVLIQKAVSKPDVAVSAPERQEQPYSSHVVDAGQPLGQVSDARTGFGVR